MKDNGNSSDNSAQINVKINEGFYFDRTLDLPTVIKEYGRVERILRELNYLACITVQVVDLSKVEYQYGSNSYNYLPVSYTHLTLPTN